MIFSSIIGCSLSLYANHLPERMDDLDQVALGTHDGVDGLIGHRGFVDYAQRIRRYPPSAREFQKNFP
jgi:hypothetical protein